jgi:hypothetical protein
MDRRRFLKLSGAGLAGATLLGGFGPGALAQTDASLAKEFRTAATEHNVPVELLLAMGYYNTLWEMPPPQASDYEEGELHGRGDYGVMQLEQNPFRDTLGRAASLASVTEEEIKNNRTANVRAGAALLADIAGESRPNDLEGWQDIVAEYAGSDLYAAEVFETLAEGASTETLSGESLTLASQSVEPEPLARPRAAPPTTREPPGGRRTGATAPGPGVRSPTTSTRSSSTSRRGASRRPSTGSSNPRRTFRRTTWWVTRVRSPSA